MADGICKLTGKYGPLVKAHIFPKALTNPGEGRPFAQNRRDLAPIKRWDSWYDPSIVTQAGEDILKEFDTWAIEELRKHRLVWSAWGSDEALSTEDFEPIPGREDWGLRTVRGLDGARLRLFYLSILWRAAVSNMWEFHEVVVRASDLRRLRRMLLERDPTPLHRFPITLIQLSTRGDRHNHSPLAQRKPRNPLRPNGPTVPIFRFYFDGLVAHIHRESNPEDVSASGPLYLGGSDELLVTTVTLERSWQHENFSKLIEETEARWPERLARISGIGVSN